MTNQRTTGHRDRGGTASAPDHRSKRTGRPDAVVGLAVGGVLVVVAAFAIVAVSRRSAGDEGGWRTVDVGEQGAPGSVYEDDGARLRRRAEGVAVEVVVPTPAPGSYDYPTHDMIPPWVEEHPPVAPGASDAPEIFTLWLIAFNDPARCTDARCDADDLDADAPARGGVYQVDGRIGDDDVLRFAGNVRLGQQQLTGSPLDDPFGAEIHLAIAPHGRALTGVDRSRQLNSPVGNPTLWWPAQFEPG